MISFLLRQKIPQILEEVELITLKYLLATNVFTIGIAIIIGYILIIF